MESSGFRDTQWADAAGRARQARRHEAAGGDLGHCGRQLAEARRRSQSGLGRWRGSIWSSHRRIDGYRGHQCGRPESESCETRRAGRSPDCLWGLPCRCDLPDFALSVARAPRPYPCRDSAICSPTGPAPPRQRPFLFLGSTSGARALAPSVQPPGSDSHLRFTVPKIEPGVYAFVIFAMSRRGPPGSLIADTGPGQLLRILRNETPVGSAGDGSSATLWIVAGTGTIALVLAAVLLLRRQRAS
jgi:hypothetical protein